MSVEDRSYTRNDIIVTATNVKCPKCGEPSVTIRNQQDSPDDIAITQINRLYNRTSCASCGELFVITGDLDNFTLSKDPSRRRVFSLLKLASDTTHVYLVVEDILYSDNKGEFDYDKSYFYNEHTCPTNYLGVEAILDVGMHVDDDPHGVFRFVTCIDRDEVLKNTVEGDVICWEDVFSEHIVKHILRRRDIKHRFMDV